MTTQNKNLFQPGKNPLPVVWHNSAWHPRVVIRRGYHRRHSAAFNLKSAAHQTLASHSATKFCAIRFSGAVMKLEFLQPPGHAPMLAPALHYTRRTPEPQASSVGQHPHTPAFAPWPRRTFIFSRLPFYSATQLAKLASI